jgi:hypothetical protein
MFIPHMKHLRASAACYGDSFTFLHVDYVRASQQIRLWASTACYAGGFTFVYVDYVRTLQETPAGLHGLLRR